MVVRYLPFITAIVMVVIIVFATQLAHARPVPGSFANLVERLSPAVVNISTSQTIEQQRLPGFQFRFPGQGNGADPFRQFFEQFNQQFGGAVEREVQSLGSGFVIDADGYIVTNNHVVAGADQITVTFSNNDSYEAELVGRDKKTDLALLKIDAGKDVPYVRLGNSEKLRVGDWVIAIGNPFGLGGSVSAGIVSARSRNINAGPFDDFIQTDAAINRGNSGGPLFDINGDVVGINTAIFSPSGGNVGIGFAVPTELATSVINQLKEHGRTFRGWLGVKIQDVTPEIADSLGLKKERGALVIEVTKGGPAEKAGLEPGDVILSFEDQPIKEMRTLPRLVAETKESTKVELEVWRDGDEEEIDVTLGELEEEEEDMPRSSKKESDMKGNRSTLLGMELIDLNDTLRQRLGVSKDVKGVIVASVKPGSEVAKRGMRPRDIILQANQKPITSIKTLNKQIEKAGDEGKDNVLLRVLRRGQELFVTIPVSE